MPLPSPLLFHTWVVGISPYQMLIFALSLLSFLLLSWLNEKRLVSICQFVGCPKLSVSSGLSKSSKKPRLANEENVEMLAAFSILDLPELALDSILEGLPPEGLCSMARVCCSLRERCQSDHLWERHLREKWGKVISESAYREWQRFAASKNNSASFCPVKSKNWLQSFLYMLPICWLRSKINGGVLKRNSCPKDSIKSWYLFLESGKFWFPAQVYNREHGHVGFVLSCYDAELSYDRHTDTFHARYPPHGRRTMVIEGGVRWERLRATPVETPSHSLHVSDCLNELCPGDHIEIQWRKSREFSYGWWYGVVGHLESCTGNENLCHCHKSDTIILEFNQYKFNSRWRQTIVNRKFHGESGSEGDGFYGGIRKLHTKEEITTWKRLWPNEVLE